MSNATKIYTELESGVPGEYVVDYSQVKNAPDLTKIGNVSAEDTSDELYDVETNTYLKYVAQALTENQKQQSRNNIGAASTEYVLALFNELKDMILSGGGGGTTMPDAILDNAILNNAKLV